MNMENKKQPVSEVVDEIISDFSKKDVINIIDAYINFNIDKKKNEIHYTISFYVPGVTPLPKADLQEALAAISKGIVSPEK